MSRGRTPPVKDTYSTHDVAKICCVTPTTVIRWIEDGLIPAFKTVGGHRRVRREDLEKVCSERGIPFNVQTGDETGRILVVDDEPVVLDLVRDVVNDITHSFEVEVARDAFDAGRLVALFKPQLIFLDLMMPGVDGFEVCSRLKRDSATAHTEIVAITGYYTEANTERILGAGAVACLRKPLDVTDVRRRVIESFRLREEPPSRAEETSPENSKVLLITQNADFRAKVQDELSGATVKVLTAQTAEDALLVAQAAPPAYVIMSLSLPDLGETDLIAKLLKGTSRPPTIIAVHDDPSEAMREAVQAAGVRMCLPTKAVTGNIRGLLGV